MAAPRGPVVGQDTARRAVVLLTPHETKRQEAVTKATDVCIREGRIDLLTEWHHYWKPQTEEELWAVGPRAVKAGMDLFAKSCPKVDQERFEQKFTLEAGLSSRSLDGPYPELLENFKGTWTIRTDRMDRVPNPPVHIRFASVAGPARLGERRAGMFLALGPVQVSSIDSTFVACDGPVWNEAAEFETPMGAPTARGIVVCRGNFTGAGLVGSSVLLVDGDIDLTRAGRMANNVIRASGEVRLPKNDPLVNCTIEAHAKDATAPYKFFEFADVGLSMADDEEGLVVTGAKPGTPFGACGIAKGDLIRTIDDAPAGQSQQFRTALRRALVRQGDCLVTVVRGDKIIDLPVFFPLPK